ncbi:MAG: SSI family serine proteinase inhibitor [Kineosporiaceae bacterium]
MPRSPLLFRAAAAAALLTSLTACAEDALVAEGGDAGTASAAADPAPVVDLTVDYDPGDGSAVETYRLACDDAGLPVDPAASGHPEARAACDGLTGPEAGTGDTDDPFARVPDDAVCTMQYGGPQTATVTGTYRGEPVDAVFTLEDGCEIARWQDAAVLAGIGPDAAAVPGRR